MADSSKIKPDSSVSSWCVVKWYLHLFSQACNDFLAGNMLSSSNRYYALDETALFGCACRHEFPCFFINLKHGERYNVGHN